MATVGVIVHMHVAHVCEDYLLVFEKLIFFKHEINEFVAKKYILTDLCTSYCDEAERD